MAGRHLSARRRASRLAGKLQVSEFLELIHASQSTAPTTTSTTPWFPDLPLGIPTGRFGKKKLKLTSDGIDLAWCTLDYSEPRRQEQERANVVGTVGRSVGLRFLWSCRCRSQRGCYDTDATAWSSLLGWWILDRDIREDTYDCREVVASEQELHLLDP